MIIGRRYGILLTARSVRAVARDAAEEEGVNLKGALPLFRGGLPSRFVF